VDVGGLRFVVMLARGGAVRWFRVTRVTDGTPIDHLAAAGRHDGPHTNA
jgi:hypothetical protein